MSLNVAIRGGYYAFRLSSNNKLLSTLMNPPCPSIHFVIQGDTFVTFISGH
jgi:hypothetical protein